MRTDAGGTMAEAQGITELESWENEGGPASAAAHAERLDWTGFLARFYPEARRHDYASLAAYMEYRSTGLSSRGQ